MAPKALHARDLVKGMNALHLFDAVFTYTTQGTFILGYDICLFANLGCPTYRLYVGAYKKQPEPITWGHRQH
jgi:hypothetical protein